MKKLILLVLFLFLIPYAQAENFLTTHQIWDDVQLLGNYAESNPLFTDSTGTLQPLVKDAYNWVQSVSDGYSYTDRLTLVLTTSATEYSLEPSGYSNEIIPVKVNAVRRYSATGNPEALTSHPVGDFNKVFDVSGTYPNFYAVDHNKIYFNSYPSAGCTMYVYASRVGNADSTCVWGRIPPIASPWRSLMVMKLLAMAKYKEGNEVAEENINRIVNSMLDLIQVYQMADEKRDITILPGIYED